MELMKETVIRHIDFCDVDCTGVMWHGAYCKYYEDARCNLLKKLGFSYEKILKEGFQIPIISLSIRYSKPCSFNQLVEITAYLTKSDHMLLINYEIADNQTKEKLSTAETRHVIYDMKQRRAILDLPSFMKEKLAEFHD